MRLGDLRDLPPFLTVEEAAELLRLKKRTAYDLVARGEIPSVRLGRFIRIPAASVIRMARLGELEEGGAGPEKHNS
ncbi:DNA binding domain protein, excisionase family [Ammonifex degensii KC4]|uniref:DNA binding domain protein, excisionase family n=1 Tax=Ammonifex degensii (strain DSM 10501 / KC4) TaxID=429009 RepID=C9RCJ4_AMMDK|nr:helix-turn-helix domain-containing protein [Ammonifex degensii]ACX51971.1 DNA binding domain protein, excisionase family [Ammonifex degensii KC4]